MNHAILQVLEKLVTEKLGELTFSKSNQQAVIRFYEKSIVGNYAVDFVKWSTVNNKYNKTVKQLRKFEKIQHELRKAKAKCAKHLSE